MVDPRILHQVTVELATGFLMLAGIGVGAKLASDLWLRKFRGRNWTLDRWARSVGTVAEPTSFFALAAGVLISFVTSYTGLNVWPASELWSSPTVHNKMLLVMLSTTLFLGAFLLRLRFKARIWLAPSTGALYALLVLAANGFLVFQNSVGGHLQGTGSLLDDLLQMVHLDETALWTFPTPAAAACLLLFPLVVLGLGMGVRASNRIHARAELVPLAREVKYLLVDARRADLGIDGPRRLIGRANDAARKGQYVQAVRLLEKARSALMIAPPFNGTVEEVEFWASVDALPVDGRPALESAGATDALGGVSPDRALPARAGDATAAGGPEIGGLNRAVSLVDSSLRRFEEAPLLHLQEELRGARDTLLEFKTRGHDLTEPVRMLKAAHAHIQKAEWNDAIRTLEEFRREMGRLSDAGSSGRRLRDEPETQGRAADEP